VIAAIALGSCGDDGGTGKYPVSPPGGGGRTTTTFTGFFGDARGYAGPIRISVASPSLAARGPRMAGASRAPARLIAATAMIDLGHSTVLSLSGWYDSGDRSIALAGGSYSFFGATDTLAGIPTLVAEDRTSGYNGAFAALLDTAITVPVYCGVATNLGRKLGVEGFARVDTTLIGVAHVNFLFEWFLLEGVLTGSGNARSFHLEGATQAMSTLTMDGIFYLGTGTGGGTYSIFRESSGTETGDWDAQPCN
jgi:hypothetical protein